MPGRVLFLSYHFPPIGGAGAQRPARLVRYLAEHGYDAIVVTGQGRAAGRWTPSDESLVREVPPEVEVLRAAGPEPAPSTGWRHRAERWLTVEAPWTRWWTRSAIEAARNAGAFDLVYNWMQPYETAKAAVAIARQSSRPLVADLGDPWALDEMMMYPSALHRRLDLARMREYLRAAAAVVMSTPEAVRRVRERFPELHGKEIVAIPNGFDDSDFATAPPVRDDAAFRIVHTGYLHTNLGRSQRRAGLVMRALGGSLDGVDLLTRSHVYLLEAIERLAADDPDLASSVELHLAGVLSDADRDVVGSSPYVRVHGYLSHGESVALVRSADLLFLPMQNLPTGRRATIVPGKTYEYLASGKRILAAVPDGDARDLLAEAGDVVLCRPDDIGGMAEALRAELRRVRSGNGGPTARRSIVERYEYSRLSGELGAMFDRALRQ